MIGNKDKTWILRESGMVGTDMKPLLNKSPRSWLAKELFSRLVRNKRVKLELIVRLVLMK